MSRRARIALAAGLVAGLLASSQRPARAQDAAGGGTPTQARDAKGHAPLEALVPELAAHPYRLAAGERPYRDRISISPGYGTLGSNTLYTLRAAYNPQSWLGYEATLAHNPGPSVHAVMHTLCAVVRRPLPGRFEPYATAGYGMMIVFPGLAVNAVSVTKNALVAGGGLEVYVRSDLALRAELDNVTVFGEQRDRAGVVTYPYSQGTIGLAFYRSIRP